MSAPLSRTGRSATGAVVGGLGIAAMALVRSTVASRRVRTADDVSTRTPYTVVLEVASDTDGRRRTDDLHRVASTARASTGGQPRVYAVVAAQAGAVAATAEMASALARELGSSAAPSLLVRTDTRRVSGPSSGRGFLDVLAHVDADLGGVTSHRDDGVRVVGAGNRALDPAGVVTPDAVSSFYEDARGHAETVVVEAAPVTEFSEAQIICGLADTVVTVIDPRTATVDEVTRTHLLLTQAGAEVGPAVVMGTARLPPTVGAPGQSRPLPDSPAVGDKVEHDLAAVVTELRGNDTRDARGVATEEQGPPHDAGLLDGGGPDEMENTDHGSAARTDLAAEQESPVTGQDTAEAPGENADRSAPDPVDRADEVVPPVLTWKPRPSAAAPSTRSRLARVLGRSNRHPLGENRRTGRGLIAPVVTEPTRPAVSSEPQPTQPATPEVVVDGVDGVDDTITEAPVTQIPVAEPVADDEGDGVQIPEPEAVVEPEPEAVVEPEPEAVVEPEPEAVVEPEPEASFDDAAPHEEGTPTPIVADGAMDAERDRVVRDRWEQELLARQRWIVEQQTQEHQREHQRAEELAKRRRVVADREARFRKEREEAAREEALRIDRERAEQARVEQLERERFARAVAEREQLERMERDRVAHLEHERRVRAQAARERLAREQRAREERAAMEEAALARAEAERVAAERAEAMRLAAERAEANRLAAERAESERIAAERRAEERREAHRRLEAERAARDEQRRHLALQQQAAREQWAQEQWAQYRLAQDRWLEEQWARYRVEQRQWLQRLAAGVDLPPPAPPSPTPIPPLPMSRALLPVVDATVHDSANIPPS